jgi:hypothetical protein
MSPEMTASSDASAGPPPACCNCAAPMNGPYCSSCGQRRVDLDRPLGELAREALDAFFAFDARILGTLRPLISRPGWLTLEYLAGRRARFVHPFKLYFAFSVLLFLALALSGYSVIRVADGGDLVVTTDGVVTTEIQRNDEAAPRTEAGSALETALGPLFELMQRDPDRLNRIFTDRLAKSVIVLVPIFALLLRALYRRRTYVAQLVFSLHLHSFAFLVLVLGLGLDTALGASRDQRPGNLLAVLAIAVYTFLALRRFNAQGRLATAAKMVLLAFGYLIAVLMTMLITLAVTAFSL